MNAKIIIGIIIILAATVWGVTTFMGSTIQYVSITQAKASTRTVQVMGKIDKEHVSYNSAETRLEFAIYDDEAEDETSAEKMNVIYYGTVPGNFDQATSVVCKGTNKEEGFVAEKLFVKCPSKYQGEGDEEYQDINLDQAGDEMKDTEKAKTTSTM
jgi:cytochrome c-type biogenesis protein CcmE